MADIDAHVFQIAKEFPVLEFYEHAWPVRSIIQRWIANLASTFSKGIQAELEDVDEIPRPDEAFRKNFKQHQKRRGQKKSTDDEDIFLNHASNGNEDLTVEPDEARLTNVVEKRGQTGNDSESEVLSNLHVQMQN